MPSKRSAILPPWIELLSVHTPICMKHASVSRRELSIRHHLCISILLFLFPDDCFLINDTPPAFNNNAISNAARKRSMTRISAPVALAVPRSVLNADIDGISVTKRFHAIEYAGEQLRSQHTCTHRGSASFM